MSPCIFLPSCLRAFMPSCLRAFLPSCLLASYDLLEQIAGGVYFDEFKDVPKGPAGDAGYALYALGILLNVVGLSFLAPPSPPEAIQAEQSAVSIDHAAAEGITAQLDGSSPRPSPGSGSSSVANGKPPPPERGLSKRKSVAQLMPSARLNRVKKKHRQEHGSADGVFSPLVPFVPLRSPPLPLPLRPSPPPSLPPRPPSLPRFGR